MTIAGIPTAAQLRPFFELKLPVPDIELPVPDAPFRD